MTVKIRMTRGGRIHRPFYHVVVQDGRMARDGRFIEKLGHIDPLMEENAHVLDTDRINYWLSVGAQPSETLARLFTELNLGSDKQRKQWKTTLERRSKLISARRKAEADKKAAEEAKVKAEADAAAAAEAAEAAAAEAPAEEAPAVEAPAEEEKKES